MALSSEGGDELNNTVYSPIFPKRQQLTGTLTSPSLHAQPLPSLPFELIEEILSRLPVKLLLQLRCACKSWNSLISDHKFAKKHLSLSTTHNVHWVEYSHKYILKSYQLDSGFTNCTNSAFPQFDSYIYIVGSCNGILCLASKYYANSFNVRLLNPTIRKLKELPPLVSKSQTNRNILRMYGFGYDPVGDNYKVVSVLCVIDHIFSGNSVEEDEVKVHTLGTNSWKIIPMLPFPVVPVQKSGQCVSGTINWLASKDTKRNQCFILSLDLGNESYQKVL
jgi:hypothetical protein